MSLSVDQAITNIEHAIPGMQLNVTNKIKPTSLKDVTVVIDKATAMQESHTSLINSLNTDARSRQENAKLIADLKAKVVRLDTCINDLQQVAVQVQIQVINREIDAIEKQLFNNIHDFGWENRGPIDNDEKIIQLENRRHGLINMSDAINARRPKAAL